MRLDLEKRKLSKGYLVNRDGFPSTGMFYEPRIEDLRLGAGKPKVRFYCGRKVIGHGYCGPLDGPSCPGCAVLM